jgi:hypothetical protein
MIGLMRMRICGAGGAKAAATVLVVVADFEGHARSGAALSLSRWNLCRSFPRQAGIQNGDCVVAAAANEGDRFNVIECRLSRRSHG